MVVLGTGTVTFTDIKNAFGGAATNINLGRYYKNGSYVTSQYEQSIPTSGNSLSVSQLRGRSSTITYTPENFILYANVSVSSATEISYNEYFRFEVWSTSYDTYAGVGIIRTTITFNVSEVNKRGAFNGIEFRTYNNVVHLRENFSDIPITEGDKSVTLNTFIYHILFWYDTFGSSTKSNMVFTYYTGNYAYTTYV